MPELYLEQKGRDMHQHQLNDEQTADLATKIINMINAMFGNTPRTHDMELLPLAIAHGNRWGTIIYDNSTLYTVELLSVEKQETVQLVLLVSHTRTHDWAKTRTLNLELLQFRNQEGLHYGHFGAAVQNMRPEGYSWV